MSEERYGPLDRSRGVLFAIVLGLGASGLLVFLMTVVGANK